MRRGGIGASLAGSLKRGSEQNSARLAPCLAHALAVQGGRVA